MILTLSELNASDELAQIKRLVSGVEFTDGKATDGELLQKAKNNQQIPWNHPVMKEVTGLVMRARWRARIWDRKPG